MQKTTQNNAKNAQKCTKSRAEKCRINSKKRKNFIKFRIHPTMFILLILSISTGLFWLFFIYFASIVYHEFAHAIIAKKLGYSTQKIVLYPTGALLCGTTDEFTFKDEILISFAGPLANLFLVLIFVCLWWLFPDSYNYLQDVAVANLSLALFNLLPVFPLDGGRILLAALSLKFQRKEACRVSRIIATIFAVFLLLYSAISWFFKPNLQLAIMSLILFISAITEDKELAIKRVSKSDIKRKKLARGIKKITLVFSQNSTLKNIYDKIDNYAIYEVCIVDENYKNIFIFSESDIENLCLHYNLYLPIKNLLHPKNFS